MLYSYGYCYSPQRRRAAETCVVTRRAKVGRGTAARDGQKCEKGTQRRRGRRGRRACVMGSVITLPLVVALVIALSFEAIRQLPSASVFDPKEGKDAGLMHVMHVVARRANVSTFHQHLVYHTRRLEEYGEATSSRFACASTREPSAKHGAHVV